MSKALAPKRLKLELEYPLRSSANILYQYISNPSGLQSWFADFVEVRQGKYTFRWDDGSETQANVVKNVTNKFIKFSVINAPSAEEYMEFRISQDAITDDVELIITEFVNEEDADSSASLWDSAVDNLKHIIGA